MDILEQGAGNRGKNVGVLIDMLCNRTKKQLVSIDALHREKVCFEVIGVVDSHARLRHAIFPFALRLAGFSGGVRLYIQSVYACVLFASNPFFPPVEIQQNSRVRAYSLSPHVWREASS